MRELMTLQLSNTSNRDLPAYPVTYGVPVAQGVLPPGTPLALRHEGGVFPLQNRVLETHADGTAKWVLLDFSLPFQANQSRSVTVVQPEELLPSPPEGVQLEESAQGITVTTPHLRAFFARESFALFSSYQVNGREMVAAGSDIILEDSNGKLYYASLSSHLQLEVIERGFERVVVQISGRHTAEDDDTLLDFRVRYTFRPHEPGVQLAYKFTNREEPEAGVDLRSIRLEVETTLGKRTTKCVRQTNHGITWVSRLVQIRENVELLTGKYLSPEARTRYGVAAEGLIFIENLSSLDEELGKYPYYLRPGNARTDMTGGLRQMYPYMGMNGDGGSALGWFFDMGNNYPKALRAERNALIFDVWPAWHEKLRVRRGQSKEHDLYLCLQDTPQEPAALEGIYFDHEVVGLGILGNGGPPVEITLDPEYARGCKVLQLHRWLKYDEVRYWPIETKLGSLRQKGSLPNRGMWDYGDYINPDRSWAQNNENDPMLMLLTEYYRRQEPSNLGPALARARHNAHVDFIAFDPDPLRQGTMPAHCPEHTDGSAYPSHMWVEGLLAAHAVSGNPDFAEAALAVGENMLRWQKNCPEVFYVDSRECGWPMLAFLRLHEFTHEERWLDACDEVYQFYRNRMGEDGEIKYEMPHGVGTLLAGYGEFISWRALFFYQERTGRRDVREFLAGMLDKIYKREPGNIVMGWACNDLFPAWAAYELSGDARYLEDNYPFLRFLMTREGNFPWGGVDMHFYLGALDQIGALEKFV
jgi:hypothetical protein